MTIAPITEPTEYGTVIRIKDGSKLMLVSFINNKYPWRGLDDSNWYEWEELMNQDPIVIHKGYKPPEPEPKGFGAQIRTREGFVLVRIKGSRNKEPWIDGNGNAWSWDTLTSRGVTVLYKGIEY